LDLYLYSIKIQTNINQNAIKYLRKITAFFEIIFKEFFFRAGPSSPYMAGLDPATHMAGLDLTSPAWSLAQASDPIRPCKRKILRVHE